MKKSILPLAVVFVFGMILFASGVKAQMGPAMMGPGYGYGPQYQQPQKLLEEREAKAVLESCF